MTLSKKSVMVSAKVTTVLFLFVIFLLLFFRNSLYFTYSAPHAEDFGIFLREEYIIGFPNTVFILFAGYIHLLPRIISWVSMKFGLVNAMFVMNWTVLFIKIWMFYLVYKSKEINSNLVKFALISYMVLMPFCNDVYNNVTHLQWWLIPLMALILIEHETNSVILSINVCFLLLAGLTGINSILFAAPCAYLFLKCRNKDYFIKAIVIIICALIQLCCIYTSQRMSKIIYEGGVIDIINVFVNRSIYQILFNIQHKSDANVFVFIAYSAIALFNLYCYRRLLVVRFVFLFSAVYTVVISYNFIISNRDINFLLSPFAQQRYFVFYRICSFVLLISSLNILFKYILKPKFYKRFIIYTCFLLCLILLKNYAIHYNPQFRYYNDVRSFENAKPGEIVKFHFPTPRGWHCELPYPRGTNLCDLKKK